jgi:hypothetical protein
MIPTWEGFDLANEKVASAPLDITVGGHHFHRSESGMVTHHVNGRPDHSSGGIMSTVEAFAQEIERLRKLVPSEAATKDSPPRLIDPMGSRPDA